MGGACSTPHIDTNEPPLEILVLSDGCSSDTALVQFLTQPGWLAASSILQRRLPPRQPHKLPPPISVSTQHALNRKRSSRSDPAGGIGVSGSVHPAPQPASTTASASNTPSASPSVTPTTGHSPPSSSPVASTTSSSSSFNGSPTAPPLLYFLCDTHPISVRFHTCPDYSAITKRRASTLAKQARPHPSSHHRRPSASAHNSQPIQSTSPLDGAIVFLSTRDALVAGSVLIAGIRPMLKRRVKDSKAVGLAGSGSDKGRPVVGRVGAEGNMLPFVVVGLDEEREEETRTAAEDSPPHHLKSNAGGRIVVQPRSTDSDSKKDSDSSPSPSPRSSDSNPLPAATTIPTPPPPIDETKPGLVRPRSSLSHGSSNSVSERPNSSSVILPRKMGVEEGKGLAVDSGAVGYAAVDVKTGKAMDAALKQLVLAIRKDRQLRGHHTAT